MMDRRRFLKTTSYGTLGFLGALMVGRRGYAQETSGRRPNILLVITDDQGFGDLHSHGNDLIDTPNQDRFAEQGARFDRFYVCPVCSPTRAGLLTGRYHPRMGVSGTSNGWERMRTEEVTVAEILKTQGYSTGGFGKWHNGHYYPEHPNAQGFDEFVGFCMGHWNGYFDPRLERNGEHFQDKGYIVDVVTDHAIEFMEKHKEDPFLCYVAYNVPHSPYLVPDHYFNKYKALGLDDLTSSVYGMTECMDQNFGRLLTKVDELGLAEETIVIFMSDNGPARLEDYPRFNAGMRGSKGSVHEGGVRVPFFVRWPGRVSPGDVVKPIAASIDVLPTLIDLAEISLPDFLELDGISVAPLLRGNESNWPDRKIFSLQSRGPREPLRQGAVRSQRWLAVNNRFSAKTTDIANDKDWELYDMLADPSETTNVASQNPAILKEFCLSFEEWFKDVTRDGFEPAPIPVGYPERPEVDVFVQDAHFVGELGKGIANNGYITDWLDPHSHPEWTLDIVTPGTYAISLLYTCPESELGSKMRLTIGEQKLEGTVLEAWAPDFLPSPQRPPFEHYYEKLFRPMPLGRLRLKKGVVKMVVQPLQIANKTPLDLKAVRIRRIG